MDRCRSGLIRRDHRPPAARPHLTDLGLSRYVDPGGGCVTVPDTAHHRAMAESGWDDIARFDRAGRPPVPASWAGRAIRVHLPRYPWPGGTRCAA